MKRILAILLCILMCSTLTPKALATNPRDFGFETALASQLEQLGLFRGLGKNAAGETEFALSQKLSRVEAVVMLVRTLGKASEAEAYPKTHPFTDVPAWADGYVSYAYDQKLTNGLSATRFGSNDTVSAAIYLTFLLRSLGYPEGEGGDFTWDAPWCLAGWCGIIPPQVDKIEFLRADAVDLSCAALFASMKGTNTSLQKQLVSQGVFTEEQFKSAFPQDPFSEFRHLDRKVSETIATKEALGLLNNVYTSEFHMIVDAKEEKDVLIVTAMVYIGSADILKGNTIGSYGGSGMGPWIIVFDAKTLELQSCQTIYEYNHSDLSSNYNLPKQVLALPDSLYNGTLEVLKMETQMKLDNKTIAYQQPSYEQVLADVSNDLRVAQKIETKPCTILLAWLEGTPHGSYAELLLVYKPNSTVGEGNVISLPMPSESYWFRTSEPKELHLSQDGLTLYYSYSYDDRFTTPRGDPPVEYVHHEAGTYRYTVDLNSGTTSVTIEPN